MYDVEIRRKRVAPLELVQAKPIACPALPHRATDRSLLPGGVEDSPAVYGWDDVM